MKQTKIYCDICGKEITTQYHSSIDIGNQNVNPSQFFYIDENDEESVFYHRLYIKHYNEVCYNCHSAIDGLIQLIKTSHSNSKAPDEKSITPEDIVNCLYSSDKYSEGQIYTEI